MEDAQQWRSNLKVGDIIDAVKTEIVKSEDKRMKNKKETWNIGTWDRAKIREIVELK